MKTRPELTTLLINCYAKLKDVSALDRFVQNEDDLAVDGATAVVAEKTIPSDERTKSRCDFFCVDDDGFDHWIEVKNCHSSYPDEPLLRSYGYFPDSVSERAARHCRELAKLAAKPNTRCTVVIVASRARKSDGILFYDYEFSKPGETRELLSMCVHKQRLWQLAAKSPEKSWKKYEGIYRNVLGSFVPKL